MRRGAVSGKRTLNTRHILFVVSGAFSGLTDIIEKRLSEHSVGFAAHGREAEKAASPVSQVVTRDLVDYGFEPEFVGRLPIRVALDSLNDEDLFRILTTSAGSILLQYKDSFRGYGIDVAFEEEALRSVARRAHTEETGARGLMTVLESCLRPFKFHLPGGKLRRFGVSARLVEDAESVLRDFLASPALAEEAFFSAVVDEFEVEFAHAHGVRLAFDEAAVQMASALATELHLPLKDYLHATFKDYADFLRKIASDTGRESLPVTPQILSHPGEGLGVWMQA
jgi:hypothetical protein